MPLRRVTALDAGKHFELSALGAAKDEQWARGARIDLSRGPLAPEKTGAHADLYTALYVLMTGEHRPVEDRTDTYLEHVSLSQQRRKLC